MGEGNFIYVASSQVDAWFEATDPSSADSRASTRLSSGFGVGGRRIYHPQKVRGRTPRIAADATCKLENANQCDRQHRFGQAHETSSTILSYKNAVSSITADLDCFYLDTTTIHLPTKHLLNLASTPIIISIKDQREYQLYYCCTL